MFLLSFERTVKQHQYLILYIVMGYCLFIHRIVSFVCVQYKAQLEVPVIYNSYIEMIFFKTENHGE